MAIAPAPSESRTPGSGTGMRDDVEVNQLDSTEAERQREQAKVADTADVRRPGRHHLQLASRAARSSQSSGIRATGASDGRVVTDHIRASDHPRGQFTRCDADLNRGKTRVA